LFWRLPFLHSKRRSGVPDTFTITYARCSYGLFVVLGDSIRLIPTVCYLTSACSPMPHCFTDHSPFPVPLPPDVPFPTLLISCSGVTVTPDVTYRHAYYRDATLPFRIRWDITYYSAATIYHSHIDYHLPPYHYILGHYFYRPGYRYSTDYTTSFTYLHYHHLFI